MRVADAVAALEAGADFVGVNFTNSRRRVSVEEAAVISASVGSPLRDLGQDEPPPLHPGRFDSVESWFSHGAEALERLLQRKRPLVVGVFEDQSINDVNEIAEEAGLDLVQLSGEEPWTDCLLATRQAIKAIRPRQGEPVEDLLGRLESGAALAFMLDPSRGRGERADLELARELGARMPFWLAGGLNADNVSAAIVSARPWAVDVASGVETDGAKDPAKIAAFVAAAKGVAV
jgi:phosphoribosylanthranilate isomerase